jgi:golgi phosphoprotein 3
MKSSDALFLHQEILLLAMRDDKGTIEAGSMYQYAIGGAIVAEMLLNGRIQTEKSRRKELVTLINSTPFGNALLDHCLTKIAIAKRKATVETWVSRFAGLKNLKHIIANELCDKGILKADEDKVLLIFSRKIYPEIDPQPEQELIERLRKAIFTETMEIDPRTVVLLSLANSSGLLRANFSKKDLCTRSSRVEQIVKGEITGKATKQAIEAVEAAIMVACIMPAVISASTSH